MRYVVSYDTKVYALEKSLSAIAKGSQSLVVNYINFKSFWDEWLSYGPSWKCNCDVMLTCTCELPNLVVKTQEKDVLIKYLIGLDESYDVIRSQILICPQQRYILFFCKKNHGEP